MLTKALSVPKGGILVIFNMFTVRERKYEIGVLAAIGMISVLRYEPLKILSER